MSVRTKLVAALVTSALALGLGAVPAAAVTAPSSAVPAAVTAPATVSLGSSVTPPAGSTTPSPSLAVSGSLTPGAVTPGPGAGTVTPQAVPIWIRLAAQAALATLKATSKATYNTIVSAVARGKVAFLNAWNKLPAWVKGLFPAVAASAIYDAIKWVLGF